MDMRGAFWKSLGWKFLQIYKFTIKKTQWTSSVGAAIYKNNVDGKFWGAKILNDHINNIFHVCNNVNCKKKLSELSGAKLAECASWERKMSL